MLRQSHASWPQTSKPRHYHFDIFSATLSELKDQSDENGPPTERSGQQRVTRHSLNLDRDLWARNISTLGLILGWGAALSTLATGIIILASPNVAPPPFILDKLSMIGPTPFVFATGKDDSYLAGHWVYNVTMAAMFTIPLILQVIVTLVSCCLGSIHATTLRWALLREGRLRYNANLRLLTTARRYGPNKLIANVAAIVGLVLTYGGTSVLTFPVSVIAHLDVEKALANEDPFDFDIDGIDNRYGIDFNGWGLTGLGTGLLFQAVISTWALLDCKHVGTWNQNPLATARAFRASHGGTADNSASESTQLLSPTLSNSRSKVRTNEPETPISSEPVFRQPSPLSRFPTVRKLANCIWAVFAALSIMVLVIAIRASQPHATHYGPQSTTSIEWVQNFVGHSDPWYVWQNFGMVEAPYNATYYQGRGEWVGLLIQTAVLVLPIFGLHVADLLSQLIRDESTWRRATATGADPDSSVFLEAVRSWPTWVTFTFSAVVPWVAGYAVACNSNIYFATLPMLTMAVMFLILGIFAEYLIRIQPIGAQPSTYGDIQALAALVDDWHHKKIFWGDKGEYSENERLAGTAGHRLADLQEGVMYVGLTEEL